MNLLFQTNKTFLTARWWWHNSTRAMV